MIFFFVLIAATLLRLLEGVQDVNEKQRQAEESAVSLGLNPNCIAWRFFFFS